MEDKFIDADDLLDSEEYKNVVFVYGTLKSGNPIRGAELITGCKVIGEAVTSDAKFNMYDMGAFPAVVFNGTHKVSGELLECTDEGIEILDSIEGVANQLYNRIDTVKINDSEYPEAMMYHIPVQRMVERGWIENPVNDESPHITLVNNTLIFEEQYTYKT